MAWTSSGLSVALTVTDAGASMPLQYQASQCRVWNEGPNACRVRYSTDAAPADDYDIVLPAGLLEVHGKGGMRYLSAKTKPGETAGLHVICGSGD